MSTPQLVNLARDDDGSLIDDDGLETVATISLFTDALANPEDVPAGEDRRGYWLDAYEDNPQERTGSRLWLRQRQTITPQTLLDCEQDARDALAWMIEDGAASRIEAQCVRLDVENTAALNVQIYKPGDPNSPYELTWELHFALQ